jgi:hypothetical protein
MKRFDPFWDASAVMKSRRLHRHDFPEWGFYAALSVHAVGN